MSASNKRVIQYPAQTGPYKVFVKDKGLWRSHKTARLQISIGNPKHDGEKFFALAEWAAARFDHVILIVSDTLQRHNLALYKSISEETAYDLSLKQGEYWLAKNSSAIEILPNKTITRWNDWIDHPAYSAIHNYLKCLYTQNEDVKSVIRKKAEEFSERRGAYRENDFLSKITETSIQYILEEIAAFAIMFSSERAIDVYPGSWFTEVFDVLKNADGHPAFEGFKQAKCLRVDFVRNKTNSIDSMLYQPSNSNLLRKLPAKPLTNQE